MSASSRQRRRLAQWLGYLGGAALTAIVGWALSWDSTRYSPRDPAPKNVLVRKLLLLSDGLSGLSYDILFLTAPGQVPNDLVMVLLDSRAKANLGQPTDQPLDRRFQTRLLQRLTADGARLVIYDLLFDQPGEDVADAEFAEAMRQHGRVVLGADYFKQVQVGAAMDGTIPPIAPLAARAAAWGLATISPDPDFAIRKLDAGLEDHPSLGWVAAEVLGAPVTQNPRARITQRWLNYYCPPDSLDAVNFDHALQPSGLPVGFFRDKIVVVGSRPSIAATGVEREEFLSPFSRYGGRFATGPMIQAFSTLNFLRGDWFVRLSPTRESAVIAGWALIISAVLIRLRPWLAAVVAVVCAGLFALAACYAQIRQHFWFSWLPSAAVQTSVALVWSVGFQYAVVRRRQRQLRTAFASYLSPYMAERIANSDFDLSLGGQEAEATVMFTDLEGFTKMSEMLAPAEVSKILTTYFNQTTRFILEQNATIIKYMGDAVQVAWGVPWPEAKHAERAVQAALAMNLAGRLEVAGRRLNTRIGISTGLVLAGNLGSDFRFDYAVIGDTTNLASRLEGLNKYLGTDILISEFTQRQLSADIQLRAVGKFIVAGKAQPVGVYEVLGRAANFTPEPVWLSTFARALEKFTQREFDDADVLLRRVIEQRGGKDGPAQFYLEEIQKTRARIHPGEAWDGTVRLESK